MSGVASVVAFAASSVKGSPVVTDWMAFGSGCMGTLSLVLLLFANYSAKAARDRTRELNAILRVVGVTPMPNNVQPVDDETANEDEHQQLSFARRRTARLPESDEDTDDEDLQRIAINRSGGGNDAAAASV